MDVVVVADAFDGRRASPVDDATNERAPPASLGSSTLVDIAVDERWSTDRPSALTDRPTE